MSDPLHELIKDGGSKITILPGGVIPANADWHLCTDGPMPNAVNFTGQCGKCGGTVYFSDERPTLKKICVRCALELSKSGGVEHVGCFNSLVKAILSQKQN